jgi:NAD(P)-dependent dehydrogenase (short-subunit alcohol dehydrogenase family)
VAFAPACLAQGAHAQSPVHQAAQAGLRAFADALREQSEGVRVMCAQPGAQQGLGPWDHWAPLYDAANTLLDALEDGDEAWTWHAPGATQRSLGAALAGY